LKKGNDLGDIFLNERDVDGDVDIGAILLSNDFQSFSKIFGSDCVCDAGEISLVELLVLCAEID
jgi:hypothetical protein